MIGFKQIGAALVSMIGVLAAGGAAWAQEISADAIAGRAYDPATLMWYNTPGTRWEEALPVGNGRLGAMVYGDALTEHILLNEDTYWSGGPYSQVVKGGHEVLPEIQQLVFNGELLKAHNLFGRRLMGYPIEQQKYQVLGDLYLFAEGVGEGPVTDYKRWLDLRTGIATVTYRMGDVTYRREVFSSVPDQVIAVRITADKPGMVSFKANLRGQRNKAHSNYATDYFQMDGAGRDGLVVRGKSADYLGITGQIHYESRLQAVPEGGRMWVDGVDLHVGGADAVTLYVAAATNFVNYHDVSADQAARVADYFAGIDGKSFATIRDAHKADHEAFFGRVDIQLPATENSYLPTDERLKRNLAESDPLVAALAYQFGRYVLITSSRPGTQPANLQGIWNGDMNPAWDSKYTTNINTEMNYWAASMANLPEMVEPLYDLVNDLVDQGTDVAREHYGADGWVFHQNTDLWRVAAPMDGPTWGTFTTGGAWLCNELYRNYLVSGDKQLRAKLYPLFKGSVTFFLDFLVPHPNGKWLVTNPSTSPENFPDNGTNGPYFDEFTSDFRPGTSICAGSTIDMQILDDLFAYYLEMAEALGEDADLAEKVAAAKARLVPPQIGADGSLQEWADDWGQLEPEHRHASHMYGLYPGDVISVKKTPEFLDACKVVLEKRGDGATGWSRAWKTALWARLHDGNRANQVLRRYMTEQTWPQLFGRCGTPMQVDATLGITAAVTEMLVQSNDGFVEFLPACPDEWREGSFRGVCVRGAFELDFDWKAGKVGAAAVVSKQGAAFRFKPFAAEVVVEQADGKHVETRKNSDGTLVFDTTSGTSYRIVSR
ncbi:MAG TPA: glycoside hydrolase family 95 protein [Parapedobacter sp.]|nr:glycoside hydrolase family 95 protein [Parapedobacter sp.]